MSKPATINTEIEYTPTIYASDLPDNAKAFLEHGGFDIGIDNVITVLEKGVMTLFDQWLLRTYRLAIQKYNEILIRRM